MMEHIICRNLMSHLDHHKMLTDHQFGFRKKRSCETQLLITIKELANLESLDSGKQIDCTLLDFSKAFDEVSHKHHIIKLQHCGVQGPILCWIETFLEARTREVIVKGEHSDIIPVTSGMPQGTVLGPALVMVYINHHLEWESGMSIFNIKTSQTTVSCTGKSTTKATRRHCNMTLVISSTGISSLQIP